MEGLLAILIAAISLALFLQKQTPKTPTSSNYMKWDIWARDKGWSFFPPNQDAPMTIIGNRNDYAVYVYARKYDNMVDDYNDDTEVKIPLKHTIADGLMIQSWDGIDRMPKNEQSHSMKFNRGSLDDALCLETRDLVTTQWVINQPPYREVIEKLLDQHPLSRIEQRTLVMRKHGLETEELEAFISDTLGMAESLDEATISTWEKVASTKQWDLRSKNKGGHPSLKGKQGDIDVRIMVQDNYNPHLEMHFDLPIQFPRDFRLAGKKVILETDHLKEGFEGNVLYYAGKSTPMKNFQQNPDIILALIPIFKEFPKSKLKERRLTILCPGKCNDVLEKWLEKCLTLSQLLLSQCPPPPSS